MVVGLQAQTEEELKSAIMNAGPAEYNKLEGIEAVTEVPEGVSFEPPVLAKVMGKYDGEYTLSVSEGESKAGGRSIDVTARCSESRDAARLFVRNVPHRDSRLPQVTPDSMTLEDYYAGFADAPEWVTVSPAAGRLDRKGGTETTLTVTAAPENGETFDGPVTLVVVLPDDIDKAYKIDLKVGAGVESSEFDAGSDEELD